MSGETAMTVLRPVTLERLRVLEARVLAQAGGADARLIELMIGLVRHAHAFVRETRPTPEEWSAAIDFLIRVGQISDTRRNELILLSDMLGLTSAVDEVNFPGLDGATPSSVEGPFHAVAPPRANGDWIACGPERQRGEIMVVRGRVTTLAGHPVPEASVDIWQADDSGHYDSQDPRQELGNLRGLFTTDNRGEFWFRSVVPSSYPVPTDGPVGELLTALSRHPMRPAHIHVRVAAPHYRPVTTHMFIAGDPYLDSDAAFAVKEELVVTPARITDPSAAAGWNVDVPFYDVACLVRLVSQVEAEQYR
jgi:hydroxyquinol 1,2-dioxygenase